MDGPLTISVGWQTSIILDIFKILAVIVFALRRQGFDTDTVNESAAAET